MPDYLQMNQVRLLFGVLVKPVSSLRTIAGRPSALVPYLIFLLLCVPASLVLVRKVDWTATYQRQITQDSPGPTSSDTPVSERSQLITARVERVHKYGVVVYVLQNAVIVLAAGFFFWLTFNALLGAGIRYSTVLSVVCYALAPLMLGLCYLAIALSFRPDASVDVQRILPSSLAYYFPLSAAPWLVELGNSLEFLWIWTLVLIAVGMREASPRKPSPLASFGAVFGLWVLWVVAKVGWAGLFGL
ncbi:MAG TPA: YIP1 family protein [Candidatus Acidoferrales bacterium]|nr:YIP1 family protein [Candidatus Acidoferrales bacterium]